jgi:hypothetical protein
MANQPKTGNEPKPSHPKASEAVIVTLDDGSTQEFATEVEAREVHPRAWVRLKSEVEDAKDGADEVK